jgi:hypothetical protein
MGAWADDYPNARGTVTISHYDDNTKAADTDPSDGSRVLTVQNLSILGAANEFSCLTLGVRPSVYPGAGRAIGDITYVREDYNTSTFYLSGYQGATYRDLARFGYGNSFVRGWLKVGPNSSANAPLDVQGDSLLRGNVGVLSALSVSGSTTLQGPLTINSSAAIAGGLGVSGTFNSYGPHIATGTTTLNNTLTVNSSAAIAGGMSVSGTVNAYGSMNVQNLTVSGAFSIGSLTVPSLTVSGGITTGSLGVVGAITASGQLTTTKHIFLNAADGVNSLFIGNSTADSSGINMRLFCTSANPYLQFYGGTLNMRYGANGICTLTSGGNLSLTGNLASAGSVSANNGLTVNGTANVGALGVSGLLTCTGGAVSNTMTVSGKLIAAAIQSSYGTFSVTGTGSDTNLVGINIPNPTTTLRTTIDIHYSHANFNSNVYQGYLLINVGDYMTTSLYGSPILDSLCRMKTVAHSTLTLLQMSSRIRMSISVWISTSGFLQNASWKFLVIINSVSPHNSTLPRRSSVTSPVIIPTSTSPLSPFVQVPLLVSW